MTRTPRVVTPCLGRVQAGLALWCACDAGLQPSFSELKLGSHTSVVQYVDVWPERCRLVSFLLLRASSAPWPGSLFQLAGPVGLEEGYPTGLFHSLELVDEYRFS